MKDPNDKKTVDGFADLVTLVENTPPRKKPGPKPKGERALTAAEKQKAYRDRKRERAQAIKAGEPVGSKIIDLETDFASLVRSEKP